MGLTSRLVVLPVNAVLLAVITGGDGLKRHVQVEQRGHA
jgi:hypothetical protein